MTNDVKMVQKQIKAFNKALSRADKADFLHGELYANINDLIDFERMTKSGNAMAGEKFLSAMTPEELQAYASDIAEAKAKLELLTMSSKLDLEGVKDPKGALWTLYQKIEDAGYFLDSEQVYEVEQGKVDVSYRQMLEKMNKYLTNEHYLLSDFDAWFDSLERLEE